MKNYTHAVFSYAYLCVVHIHRVNVDCKVSIIVPVPHTVIKAGPNRGEMRDQAPKRPVMKDPVWWQFHFLEVPWEYQLGNGCSSLLWFIEKVLVWLFTWIFPVYTAFLFVPGFCRFRRWSVFVINHYLRALFQTRYNLNLWVTFISAVRVIYSYLSFIIIQ